MTRELREELSRLLPGERVFFDEPMGRHSSIGVGGPAEAFVVAADVAEIKKLLGWAMERGIDYRFWGGGSNTIVRDKGVRGLVIKLGDGFSSIEIDRTSGEECFAKVGASLPTQSLVRWCVEEGYSGLEGLTGVWGTIGGNLMTNAGTADGTIGDAVEEITIVDKNLRELTLKKSALKFEYRSLKLPRTAAVVAALLKLSRQDGAKVGERVDAIRAHREKTQPFKDASLGCVFRNPGKTPAGMLIEDAGLKGVRVGGARVSSLHANFIVNEGKATARDVVVLMSLVRERVKEQSGIILETEVEVIGDE